MHHISKKQPTVDKKKDPAGFIKTGVSSFLGLFASFSEKQK
jgi:hypothetical protein